MKGSRVLDRILKELTVMGLKKGDELTEDQIEKAIKRLGYYDQRTIDKYTNILLDSPYVRKEIIHEQRKSLMRFHVEPSWSYEKTIAYDRARINPQNENIDWSLIDEEDVLTEIVEKPRYVLVKM